MLNLQTNPPRRLIILLTALFALGMLLSPAPRASAQSSGGGDDYAAQKQRAFQLINQSKSAEALPILEKLAAANPNDGDVAFMLGFTTYSQSRALKTPEARKQARARARTFLVRAKELGVSNPILDNMLTGIPPDGGEDPSGNTFSENKEAEAAMNAGEDAYRRGDLEKAAASYQRAFQLAPKLYEAPLYAGDMYYKLAFREKDAAKKTGLADKAGEWFAKAIAVNPDRETAYRYWGDALMAVGKAEEARAKFVEAVIAEPYQRLSHGGLMQWAQKNGVRLGHPQIKSPNSVSGGGGRTTITVDPRSLESKDGSNNWLLYDITRAAWANGKFAKEFPEEKAYRHTLREEAEALRMVADAAAKDLKDGKVKTLEPSLAALVRLNEAGLVEAYVLFARADQGIARDYAAYRRTNRDKLRRYWNEFVIGAGQAWPQNS
ncbi:MAG TPA: hypothetical protein VF507_02595 [Pyrinomonadaceae bacterium]